MRVFLRADKRIRWGVPPCTLKSFPPGPDSPLDRILGDRTWELRSFYRLSSFEGRRWHAVEIHNMRVLFWRLGG
jgi:hypothetical protein